MAYQANTNPGKHERLHHYLGVALLTSASNYIMQMLMDSLTGERQINP